MNQRYRDFFVESVEGQEFIKKLHGIINRKHEDAEKSPDYARDNTQQAKGVREVIDLINVLCVQKKEAKPKE